MSCLLLLLVHNIVYAQNSPQQVSVGVASIDITPEYPIRLAGYGFRRTESDGILQRIHAKALVIGEKQPALLITVEVCGLSYEFVEQVAKKIEMKHGISRDRLAVTVTHTHTSPMVKGYLTTLFDTPIPEDQQKTIERYTSELEQKILEVADLAISKREPCYLSWGMGSVGFARNRRPASLHTPSQWGSNPKRELSSISTPQTGPVDHDLPMLAVHDIRNNLKAVWVSYACHCTTLAINKISGDWAGYAASIIEEDHPGCVALVSIGCGADSNPERSDRQDNIEFAVKQGNLLAHEVNRLLAGFLAPLSSSITANYAQFALPLSKLPDVDQLRQRAERNDAVGYQARVSLDNLSRGNDLDKEIPFSVQTWRFGSQLAVVFLPGEVVVDYSLRLKTELDAQRLWVNAYANHVPCYIPSERILKEGGYEGGSAMTYYNLTAPLAAGLENKIITEVCAQLNEFKSPYDTKKLAGSRPLSAQQSARLLQVADRFTIELMACEPLVQDPVAIAFGPDGKLWVAEMADYPAG
ncbi:MAG TPA: neutral/alkaline non-lysosomal ceramidase N-terminal domain-containing protein, partial [Gemmatales bacterium]|nr:neutral/alkaline non-lysosomal ceramidase N-terminal domain-containing protein [Gemmatales bacterium]